MYLKRNTPKAVKVSPKYQIVIPENVRETLGIVVGSMVEVIAKGGIAYLVPIIELELIQNQRAGKFDQKSLRTKKDRQS